MTRPIQVSLRAGEKIFVNGAVLRVDRKVSFVLLNDVTFLLESHVLQAKDTTTPLKQLYFVVQTMLIEPRQRDEAEKLFWDMHAKLKQSFQNGTVRDGLARIAELIEAERPFEALRTIRGLFPIEAAILGSEEQTVTPAA
jgi:flagellar protein FlbT